MALAAPPIPANAHVECQGARSGGVASGHAVPAGRFAPRRMPPCHAAPRPTTDGNPLTYAPMDLPQRPRRNRKSQAIRDAVRENVLLPSQFILPLFVQESAGREPVSSMPGVCRLGWRKEMVEDAREAWRAGVCHFVLFPRTDAALKTRHGEEACNPRGLVQRCVRELKDALPMSEVYTDVALDPYTSDGHDGIVDDLGRVANDATVEALIAQALSHAEAGADCVAPSDMMDGRIGAIRAALDREGHQDVRILSYAAKYASSLYGPFREALGSAPEAAKAGGEPGLAAASPAKADAQRQVPKDKKSYQQDPGNVREALREAALDEMEGADALLVKPGLPYLDVLRAIRQATTLPLACYQVSGEYAMIAAAAERGWLNERDAALEALLCMRRAGADQIMTYYATRAARWLSHD